MSGWNRLRRAPAIGRTIHNAYLKSIVDIEPNKPFKFYRGNLTKGKAIIVPIGTNIEILENELELVKTETRDGCNRKSLTTNIFCTGWST